jgi:hypothetical protein
MGQLVRPEHRPDPPLPGQGDAPQQETEAALWCVEPGARSRRSYDERSLAKAISDAIVSGKSAVIIGPICRASSSGPSISAA